MSLVMQTTIDLRSLSSPAIFAETFDVSEEATPKTGYFSINAVISEIFPFALSCPNDSKL